MFELAIFNSAMHDMTLPSPSIYYPENSNDLMISLWFDTRKDARQYLGQLSMIINSRDARINAKFKNDIEEVTSDVNGVAVLAGDYVKIISDSPDNSLSDTTLSKFSDVRIDDPIKSLQTLEKLENFGYKESLYKCHIAPQAFYDQYKNDEANIIYGSDLFHKYFDGDGKRRPRGRSYNWGTQPEMIIHLPEEPISDYSSVQVVNGVQYRRINVLITFRDSRGANSMRGRWRDGTKYLSDCRVDTHFYTVDSVKTMEFLRIKRLETIHRWGFDENGDAVEDVDDIVDCIDSNFNSDDE